MVPLDPTAPRPAGAGELAVAVPEVRGDTTRVTRMRR